MGTTMQEGVEMAKAVADWGADGINCRAHSYGHRGGLMQPDKLMYPEPEDDLPAEWIGAMADLAPRYRSV